MDVVVHGRCTTDLQHGAIITSLVTSYILIRYNIFRQSAQLTRDLL
jgi:hypothetical protein